jgi:hypothetical protein
LGLCLIDFLNLAQYNHHRTGYACAGIPLLALKNLTVTVQSRIDIMIFQAASVTSVAFLPACVFLFLELISSQALEGSLAPNREQVVGTNQSKHLQIWS